MKKLKVSQDTFKAGGRQSLTFLVSDDLNIYMYCIYICSIIYTPKIFLMKQAETLSSLPAEIPHLA